MFHLSAIPMAHGSVLLKTVGSGASCVLVKLTDQRASLVSTEVATFPLED